MMNNKFKTIILAAALALGAACGGMEGDEQFVEDESALFNTTSSSKEGKACNSKTGTGPYPGENGTYDSRGDCCWTHCTRTTCATTCLDCSTGGCKDITLTAGVPTSGHTWTSATGSTYSR